jgi:glutathione peroxidase
MNIYISLLIWLVQSFYQLTFERSNGIVQSCQHYEGKKVLLVNIATNGNSVNQIALLQTLYQQYSGTLKIIAFPSNSFGNTPESNVEIDSICRNQYQVTFDIAAKNPVIGDSASTIFAWLQSKTRNGRIAGDAAGDFHKFLLNESGQIVGQFSPTVSPMDTLLLNAINEN